MNKIRFATPKWAINTKKIRNKWLYNRWCCTFSERCSIRNSVENALDEQHQVRTSKYIIYTFIQIPDFSCPPTCVVHTTTTYILTEKMQKHGDFRGQLYHYRDRPDHCLNWCESYWWSPYGRSHVLWLPSGKWRFPGQTSNSEMI